MLKVTAYRIRAFAWRNRAEREECKNCYRDKNNEHHREDDNGGTEQCLCMRHFGGVGRSRKVDDAYDFEHQSSYGDRRKEVEDYGRNRRSIWHSFVPIDSLADFRSMNTWD